MQLLFNPIHTPLLPADWQAVVEINSPASLLMSLALSECVIPAAIRVDTHDESNSAIDASSESS